MSLSVLSVQRIEQMLLTTMRLCVFVALFSPLVSTTQFVFPYIAPSNFFFQIIIAIASICFFLLIAINPSHLPRKTMLFWAMSVFFLIQGLLIFSSIDPARSFLGSVERMGGWWNIFHYYLFFIMVVSLLNNEKTIKKLIFCSLVAASIGSFQYLISNAQLVPETSYVARYALGNPGFLANYLVLQMPLALWALLNSKQREVKVAAVVLMIVFGYITVYVGNRAAFLGLGSEIFLLCGYFAYRNKKTRPWLLVTILLLSLSFVFALTQRNSDFVKKTPFLGKITNWSLSDTTVASRLEMWKIGLQAFKQKPIVGWGREMIGNAFEENYDPAFYIINPSETWTDRLHNTLVDELVNGGIIGIGAYIFLLCVILKTLFNLRNQENESARYFFPIFGCFVVAYLIQVSFTLDTMGTYLPLFLGLSIIAAYTIKQNNSDKKTIILPQVKATFLLSACLMLTGSILFTALPAMANHYAYNAMNSIGRSSTVFVSENKKMDSIMSDKNPYKAELLIQFGRAIRDISELGVKDELLIPFQDLILEKYKLVLPKRPLDIRLRTLLAYNLYSKARQTKDADLANEAIQSWDYMVSHYPLRQQFLTSAAFANVLKRNFRISIDLMEKAVSLAPDSFDVNWNLAIIGMAAKEDIIAARAFQRAIDISHNELLKGLAISRNQSVLRTFISIADELTSFPNRLPLARDMYIKAVAINPDNPAFHANLAYIYNKLRNKKLAIKETEIALTLALGKDKEDIEKFLRTLR